MEDSFKMRYTVEDFIKNNEFPGTKIINNLYETNREITGAQIISTIDIENLAGGGQLLLTQWHQLKDLNIQKVDAFFSFVE